MIGRFGLAIALALMLVAARPAAAQTYTIVSVTGLDLGNIAAGASGDTIFTVPADGTAITKSGLGVRLTSSLASVRALVTVSCGNTNNCNTDTPKVTVAASGTQTGRGKAITKFYASTSGATALFSPTNTPPAGALPLNFTLQPIGKNGSKTFYIGYDVPIAGDNSGAASGLSQTDLTISVSRNNGGGLVSLARTLTANVFRTLSVTTSQNLSFGRVARPRTGSGTATLSSAGGSVTTSGDGIVAFGSPAPTAAQLSVTGEGGQAISVTVPTSFDMVSGASTIPVTLSSDTSGSVVLSGTLGSAASRQVNIGGTMTVESTDALGAYSGSFTVLFQYN